MAARVRVRVRVRVRARRQERHPRLELLVRGGAQPVPSTAGGAQHECVRRGRLHLRGQVKVKVKVKVEVKVKVKECVRRGRIYHVRGAREAALVPG